MALVVAAVFGLGVVGGAVAACKKRQDFRIWLHAKYGYRLCFDTKQRYDKAINFIGRGLSSKLP